MGRIAAIVGLLVAVGVLLWFFPLFHVVPVEQVQAEKQQAAFSAAQFANDFWTNRLQPSLSKAADAHEVFSVAREDPEGVRERFGRSVGLGRTKLYFLRGSGTIVSVEKDRVGVSLDGQEDEADLVLQTGLLFGNTVRDATGLLDAGDFPNSQHFNDISSELNRIIEALVIPTLKEQAEVGREVQFVGCSAVLHEQDWHRLQVIPLEVRFP